MPLNTTGQFSRQWVYNQSCRSNTKALRKHKTRQESPQKNSAHKKTKHLYDMVQKTGTKKKSEKM